MRVLLACDKFKGSMGAAEACGAIRAGLAESWTADICPIADGGEGFTETMLAGNGGTSVSALCRDALGLSLIHIPSPRDMRRSRMPSSA